MAFYRCFSGGGKPKETVLWTNSSPTSNFAAQTVSLSQKISDFDLIKLTCRAQTTNDTSFSMYFDASSYPSITTSSNHDGFHPFVGGHLSGSGTEYFRSYYRVDDTSIYISECRMRSSSGTGTNNSYAIPISITGIKY